MRTSVATWGHGWRWFLLSGSLLAVIVGTASVGAEVMLTPPLAEVNGDAISAEDLDRALGPKLRKLEEQVYELKRQQLDALIADRLLAQVAAKRGT
ncbi:MAG TPA: SurA N-terminal domain-containing protein, partial [Rubrobacter sp.]|nr:SurA N-terminal domain-containing protein [Rubrobacter sp.]